MKLQRVAIVLTIINLLLLGFTIFEVRSEADGVVSPVVKTQRFELIDAAGKIRAQLNVEDNGEVLLRFRDREGTIRTKFGAGDDGSALLLMDERTEATVRIRADKKGGGIVLYDREGTKHEIK